MSIAISSNRGCTCMHKHYLNVYDPDWRIESAVSFEWRMSPAGLSPPRGEMTGWTLEPSIAASEFQRSYSLIWDLSSLQSV